MTKVFYSISILGVLFSSNVMAAPSWISPNIFSEKEGACLADYHEMSIRVEANGGYRVTFYGEGACQGSDERSIYLPKPNEAEVVLNSRRLNESEATKVLERTIVNDFELSTSRSSGIYSNDKLQRKLMDWNTSIRVRPQGKDSGEVLVEIPAEGVVCTFKR